ncbi:hypothetical protein, partial [Mucilaginibacter sp. 22184]|uniref:hypothetical protein n=1 Tax=Mucilaginibacter sp. 22184 TaxID=3453887 RepID=UPI003F872A1A
TLHDFLFLKRTCRFTISDPLGISSHFLRRDQTFIFLSARIALTSLFTRVNFRFPVFCFAAKFALAFPSFPLSVSAFSFLRFGSAKVETFFLFPKLFFLFFILSFDRLSFPFLFLLSGLQRCETFFEIRNFI